MNMRPGTTKDAVERLLFRRLVNDYSFDERMTLYSSEFEFDPVYEAVESAPPPPPPNTPVPTPPPSLKSPKAPSPKSPKVTSPKVNGTK